MSLINSFALLPFTKAHLLTPPSIASNLIVLPTFGLFHCCRYCLKAILIILPLMGLTWLFGTLAAFNYSEVVRDIFSGLFVVCNTLQVCATLKQALS